MRTYVIWIYFIPRRGFTCILGRGEDKLDIGIVFSRDFLLKRVKISSLIFYNRFLFRENGTNIECLFYFSI